MAEALIGHYVLGAIISERYDPNLSRAIKEYDFALRNLDRVRNHWPHLSSRPPLNPLSLPLLQGNIPLGDSVLPLCSLTSPNATPRPQASIIKARILSCRRRVPNLPLSEKMQSDLEANLRLANELREWCKSQMPPPHTATTQEKMQWGAIHRQIRAEVTFLKHLGMIQDIPHTE